MLVSPSGPTRPERVARGIELLTGWGLRPVLGAATRTPATATWPAPTTLRAADLNAAFADPAGARGDLHPGRLRRAADRRRDRHGGGPRATRRWSPGFSDITALQLALWRGARLARCTVRVRPGWTSGPRLRSAESLHAALMTTETGRSITAGPDRGDRRAYASPARATGTLLGGNLCLLVSSLGTPDMPDLTGAVLLIEDVQEPPYKVDRMLTHLRRAGALDGLAGVAVGQFTDCADGWDDHVADVLADRLGDLGVPVLGGLPIGHGPGQLTVPVGVPGDPRHRRRHPHRHPRRPLNPAPMPSGSAAGRKPDEEAVTGGDRASADTRPPDRSPVRRRLQQSGSLSATSGWCRDW